MTDFNAILDRHGIDCNDICVLSVIRWANLGAMKAWWKGEGHYAFISQSSMEIMFKNPNTRYINYINRQREELPANQVCFDVLAYYPEPDTFLVKRIQ